MTNRRAIIFPLVVCLTGLAVALLRTSSNKLAADVTFETLDINGTPREYRLVFPHALRGQDQLPLVVALHGAIDRTEEMAAHTGFDQVAVDKGFVLAYLQGRNLNWPPEIPDVNPDVMVPDLEFFETFCDHMVKRNGVDARRIYVFGVSQGGAMANVLTAFCSHRIAATICNCGWLPEPLGQTPLPTTYKCPMLFVVGDKDNQVSPTSTRAACDAFEAAGHPVQFLVIPNHGHGWPNHLGINDTAWDFLSQHRQPAPL
ncbi:MAG: prolyl oligopeptidase family serine peptidase [Planctomycetales bacterium]|nr:prolyl oligopeptidase family serine peptidase [Planctomycetales bacterium]MCA9167015.1 prolyl oligopeptidase family serine peptidase [Planctomycetales bacterium]